MKLAILFCVVAFACVAWAQDDVALSEKERSAFIESAKAKLEAAKQKVDDLIEKASGVLKEKINQAKHKAEELAEKLKQGAAGISNKVYEAIKKVLDTFDSKVSELEQYAKDEGVDVTECTMMTQTVREAALAVISNSSYCLVEKIENGKDLLTDISTKYEDALTDLSKIKEEAADCVQNIDGVKAIASAFSCVTVAGVKAYWALVKKVPAVSMDIGKITFLMATLTPSVAFCMSKNSITTFAHESNEVFTSVKDCIKQKVSENIPEISFETTEKYPEQTTANHESSVVTDKSDETKEGIQTGNQRAYRGYN